MGAWIGAALEGGPALSLERPLLLGPGVLVAGLFILAALRRRRAGGLRRAVGAAAGGLAALALATAAAGPTRRVAAPEERLFVFLVDVSASVPAVERERAAAWIARAAAAAAPARRAVVAFADGAAVVVAPGGDIPGDLAERLGARPVPGARSFLDPALVLAAGLRRDREPAAAILLSDGALDREDPRPPPFPVSTVPLLGGPENLVTAEALEGPDVAEAGAPVALSVRYRAARATAATIRLAEGGETLARREATLTGGGPHLAALPAVTLAAGPHLLVATLSPLAPTAPIAEGDPVPGDDAAALALRADEPPPPLLLSDASDSAGAAFLRRALAAQGVAVETCAPATLAAGDLGERRVVIWDSPDAAMPDGAAGATGALLARFVRRGGGLLAVAGQGGLVGPAGALADVLPADVAPPAPEAPASEPTKPAERPAPPKPREVEVVKVGLVLVVDTSGSMEGRKIQLAREAAIATLETLRPGDRFGVVAVSDDASWVIRPEEDLALHGRDGWRDGRDATIARIARLAAGGGTNLFPGIARARDSLRPLPVGIRHVVLLSDGHDVNVRDWRSLAEEMARERITLSTIGVGEEFDPRLLTSLAGWGGGYFDFTDDPERVPALVTGQARWAIGRATPAQERPAPPAQPPPAPPMTEDPPAPPLGPPPEPVALRPGRPHPVTAGLALGDLPPATRVRGATLRPGAIALLETAAGAPVLALGHAGDGRVLLAALDLGAESDAPLGRWPGWPALLAQAVRFLGPAPSPAAVLVGEVRAVAGEPARVLFRLEGGPATGPFEASGEWETAGGPPTPLALLKTGPARFEARFSSPAAGTPVLCRATVARVGTRVASAEVATVALPPAEETDRPDAAALQAIAAESGGRYDPAPEDVPALAPVPTRRDPIGLPFLVAAALMLVPLAWSRGGSPPS